MNNVEPSPTPWQVNGHSIECHDERLWQYNDKTGRDVVALLPSAPKTRFNKAERKQWDDLTAANADLIVSAVNAFKGKRNVDRFNTGDLEHDVNCAVGTYCMEAADPDTGEPVMLVGAFAKWLLSKVQDKKEDK